MGVISAALTERRYQLLEIAKTKPRHLGWKLSGVKAENDSAAKTLSFNFDMGITKIVK